MVFINNANGEHTKNFSSLEGVLIKRDDAFAMGKMDHCDGWL